MEVELSELLAQYGHHGRMDLQLDMKVSKGEEVETILRALVAKVMELERKVGK